MQKESINNQKHLLLTTRGHSSTYPPSPLLFLLQKKKTKRKKKEIMTTPYFWRQPLQYLRWASHEKPAIFYSLVIGSLGPLTLFVVPPIRHRLGDGPRERIPLTYPSMSSSPPPFLSLSLSLSIFFCSFSFFIS